VKSSIDPEDRGHETLRGGARFIVGGGQAPGGRASARSEATRGVTILGVCPIPARVSVMKISGIDRFATIGRSPMSEPRSSPDNTSPFVSVVIPTYARPALLQRCLDALLVQDYPIDRMEIIVVEDGGPAEAAAVVERTRARTRVALRHIGVPRGGPAAARNKGWQAARGELIGFTDDDTIPDPRWLAEGAASYMNGAGVISGSTTVPLGPRPTDADRNTQGLERATLATCNAFCRRSLLELVGGFDERFTRAYREDSDLEFTLRDAGARLVRNPRAVVTHPPRTESRFVSVRQQRNQFFDALLYRKHPRKFRASIRAWPPFNYYAIALAQVLTVLGVIRQNRAAASLATMVWLPLVLKFYHRRASATGGTLRDRMDLLLTSAVIPPVAIFWRLKGALTFRALFL
jgi:glycosyltransferase involved in cell wall biosynthesis